MFNDMRLSSDMMKSFEKFQAKHDVRTFVCDARIDHSDHLFVAIGPGLQRQCAHIDILARRGFSHHLRLPTSIQPSYQIIRDVL